MNTGSDSGSGMAAQDDLSAAIERWLADSIITAEQARQMRADRPQQAAPDRVNRDGLTPIRRTSRAALVTEALGLCRRGHHRGGAGHGVIAFTRAA